jgi:ubiquinone/menaquinone biosynthesis C-methylase UbiE
MPDVHYENPRLAAIYDADSPWSVDRDFYLNLAGTPPQDILDMGCGTGLICNAYAAKGHHVTGADPSAAMLDVARKKLHGKEIEWVQATAQEFKSEKQFDLIIMTGHAFQVLIEDADVLAAFATMRKHLKPGGLIAFESRNPNIDWSKQWNYNMLIQLKGSSVYESRHFRSMDNGRMYFDLKYSFPDESFTSESELRFWTRDEVGKHLAASDLLVENLLGEFSGKLFDEKESEEMIFLVRAV